MSTDTPISGLESRLEAEENQLPRLLITWETVREILGEAASPVTVPAGEGQSVEPVESVESVDVQPSVRGVVTVPP